MKRLVKLMLAGAAILVAGLILNLTIVAYSVPTNDAYADEGRPSPRTSGRGRYDSEEFVLGGSSDTPTAEQVVDDVFATEPSFDHDDGFQPVPKRRHGSDMEMMGASPKSEQPLSVRIEIVKLQRQADALTKAGFEQVADQLRKQAEVLAQFSRDLRNRGWDRTEPKPIEIDQEARELQEKASILEREAAELEEHGEHEAAERHRRQARRLMMQWERRQRESRRPPRPHFAGSNPPEERESDEMQEWEHKIDHLERAADNLQEAGLEEPALELRVRAKAMKMEMEKQRVEREIRREREQIERRKREMREDVRRHSGQPREFGELLHDLRNEIRDLRAEVREMRQLIEKNLKHEVVEEVEEEAGLFNDEPNPERDPGFEEAEEAREEPVPDNEEAEEGPEEPFPARRTAHEPKVPQVEEEAAAFDLDPFGVPQEPKRQEEAPAGFGFEQPAADTDEVPFEEPSADNSTFDSN